MPTPDGNASAQSEQSTESTTADDATTATTDTGVKDEADQAPDSEDQADRTYTRAEVDKLVQDEVGRIVRKKAEELYKRRVGDVDIDELKAKAGESQTLEDRVAAMERRAQEAEASALRSRVANEYQISAEDAELFLTSTDEDALVAQAKRLAERDGERKQRSPQIPNEGRVPKGKSTADERRQFANFLTGHRT